MSGNSTSAKNTEFDKTSTLLSGQKRADDPTYIPNLAKAINRDKELKDGSAPFSKFVHPTSLSLLFVGKPRGERAVRRRFQLAAQEIASRIHEDLQSGYLAELNQKFGPTRSRVRQRLAFNANQLPRSKRSYKR